MALQATGAVGQVLGGGGGRVRKGHGLGLWLGLVSSPVDGLAHDHTPIITLPPPNPMGVWVWVVPPRSPVPWNIPFGPLGADRQGGGGHLAKRGIPIRGKVGMEER